MLIALRFYSARFFLCLTATVMSSAHACPNVISLKNEGSYALWTEPVRTLGQYCLISNLVAPRGGFVLSEGHEAYAHGEALIEIQSSDVDIDLAGYAVLADMKNLGGIRGACWQKRSRSTGPAICQRVRVHDGKLASRTDYGIVFADLFSSSGTFASLRSDFPSSRDDSYIGDSMMKDLVETLDRLRPDFPITGHVLERLRISALQSGNAKPKGGTPGVGIKGGGNAIRDSVIEVSDAPAAIYLYGPNQIIENNVIIYRGRPTALSAAPIKLHLANGSILRNNVFIIESPGGSAPQAAISLIDSQGVIAEGNKVYGASALIKVWDEVSTATETRTEFLTTRPQVP